MKITKYIIGLGLMAGTVLGLPSCTDLSETVYDQVMSKNYYNTKQDVINAVFRPFEHMYCCIWIRHENEELPADQFITPTRGTWWYDGGLWEMYHRHQYDDINQGDWLSEWENFYVGIAQCNMVLDDLSQLNPSSFGLSDSEFESFKAQLRCMRAWGYLRLLNTHRNCILTTTSDQAVNEQPENRKQVAPQVLFDFIESELKDYCLTALPSKSGQSGNGANRGNLRKLPLLLYWYVSISMRKNGLVSPNGRNVLIYVTASRAENSVITRLPTIGMSLSTGITKCVMK